MEISLAQKLAWQNKLAKGFNTTDVPLEFCLLSGEVAEAFDAWRKGHPDVAEELADVTIFLLGLAQMIGADLEEAVQAKLAENRARVYRPLPNGVLVKDAPPSSRPPTAVIRTFPFRAKSVPDRLRTWTVPWARRSSI